ncbi:MAG TPA: hypothetical protein VGP46_05015 [Acidimicrobiales bacterium]|jgi:hypothetical protein|nr:hypothetical protein [Acidimicrobiales bacterium]
MSRPSEDRLEHVPLGLRLSNLLLKDAAEEVPEPAALSADQLALAVKSADDKERLVGLLAAPIAALIGMVITSSLIANDPPALLKGAVLNARHVSVPLYYELGGVVVGLAVVMLVASMLRKRLFMGISMALYGLAVFNLHFWGFGLPFILAAAWLLVRAYRLSRDLRVATEADDAPVTGRVRFGSPQSSKRYTPPATPRRR